jgi:hypothetical protein
VWSHLFLLEGSEAAGSHGVVARRSQAGRRTIQNNVLRLRAGLGRSAIETVEHG